MKKSTGEGLRVLVGGGSGWIGSALTRRLTQQGHSTRLISRGGGLTWEELEKTGLPPCDAVINLAGANLMGQLLWTQSYRQQVWDSRVNTNRAIARAIGQMPTEERPRVFISASGVGFYPTGVPGPEVDEDSVPRADTWFGSLTEAWEASADEARDVTRVVKVRTGVVLGPGGGALASMLPAFRFGMANVMGDGRQYFPWVHLDDIVGIYEHALLHEDVVGVVNGVAPDVKNAQEFAEAMAEAMGTSVKFHMPSFALNAMFGAERASLMLEGHKVHPKRTLASGYHFQHPELKEALSDIVAKA